MSAQAADRAEIERFVEVLFRHAETGGFVSLRTFDHDPAKPPVEIRAVEINGHGLSPVIAQATSAATRAARHATPCVFAPPVCTFTTAKGASEADVREGVALSLDCDERPVQARRRLEGILGPASIVVASGGLWADRDTGELQPKFHLHWRLAEPTRDPEGHARLKRARGLCVALAGGDPSGVSVVHPFRWPGSWHRKGEAKLSRRAELRDEVEIDLADALERLEQAASLALQHASGREAERLRLALSGKGNKASTDATSSKHDPDARDPDLEALAEAIPNDDAPRAEWNNVGLAFYAASEGSAAGFNAWDLWSRKSDKYHRGTFKRWEHFAKSPPSRTGTGALVERARRADPGFRLPSWGPAQEQEPSAGPQTPDEPPATSGQPWPEPLGRAAFHGIAGEVVRAILPETEADPAALLFQFLAAAGNIIGPDSYARVEATRHPPRLFTVQVGRTGKGRKGTALDRVRQALETAAPEWVEDRIASGLSSGEGLIYAVREPVEERQIDKKTGETRTVVIDPGVTDKRLLVVESEFATALRVMEREGNTLSGVLRNAWDKGDLDTLTKNSKTRAKGAHVSIVGHVTADELRRYLDRTEAANGLANRVLFVCVQRSKLLPRGGGRIDWTDIGGRLRETLAGVPRGEIGRTDAFWKLWEPVYAELSADRPGLLGAVLGRAEAQVLRLSLIYALLDGQAFIDAVHLRAALACWRYAEDSARFIFGDSLGDPVADEILRTLHDQREGMTRKELSHHFGRNLTSEQLGRALGVLTRGNFVRSEVERTGGRPAERWRAVR